MQTEAFDVALTPSFSRAGKTASNSAGIKNVVRMAQASAKFELKKRQQEMLALTSLSKLVQYEALTGDENPVTQGFNNDAGRGHALSSSPRVAEHWQLQPQVEDEEVSQTAFQRIIQWHEADEYQEESPRGEEVEEKPEQIKRKQVVINRTSSCFSSVPRGFRAADKRDTSLDPPPPVGHYIPKFSLQEKRVGTLGFKYAKTAARVSTGGGSAFLRAQNQALRMAHAHAATPLTTIATAAVAAAPTTANNAANQNHNNQNANNNMNDDDMPPPQQTHQPQPAVAAAPMNSNETKARPHTAQPILSNNGSSDSKDSLNRPSFFFRTSKKEHSKMLAHRFTPLDVYYDIKLSAKDRHAPVIRLDRPDRVVPGSAGPRNELNKNRFYPNAAEQKEKLQYRSLGVDIHLDKLTGREKIPMRVAPIGSVSHPEDSMRMPFREDEEAVQLAERPKSVADFRRMQGRESPVRGLHAIGHTPVEDSAAPRIAYKVSDSLIRRRARVTIPFTKLLSRQPMIKKTDVPDVAYESVAAKDLLAKKHSAYVAFDRMSGHRPLTGDSITAQLQYKIDVSSAAVFRRVPTPDFKRQIGRSTFGGEGKSDAAIHQEALNDALKVGRPSTAPGNRQMPLESLVKSPQRPKSRGS